MEKKIGGKMRPEDYPEGFTPILTDAEIDHLEKVYGKPITEITNEECDAELSKQYEDYL